VGSCCLGVVVAVPIREPPDTHPNTSTPQHVNHPCRHASMLEALRLVPGDRFLDVGCGCGYLAACAALLVGPTGRVAGVDTRAACVELSEENVERLRGTSSE